MSNRLDKEREEKLQPKRMEYAIGQLHAAGIQNIYVASDDRIEFDFNGSKIKFYPYSGWATGKTIKDGRGIENLLKQLKNEDR